MPFKHVEIKGVLVGGTADASLVQLVTCPSLALANLNPLAITNHLRGVSSLLWLVDDLALRELLVVAACLWSSFELVLDLLSLLLVRFTDRDALADLLLLGSVEGAHLLLLAHSSRIRFGW